MTYFVPFVAAQVPWDATAVDLAADLASGPAFDPVSQQPPEVEWAYSAAES